MRLIDADKLMDKMVAIKSEVMTHAQFRNDAEKEIVRHLIHLINMCIDTVINMKTEQER